MRNIEKVSKYIRYEAAENGIKLAIVPISCLGEVKADMQMLSEQNDLNGFQKEIINRKYILDVPSVDFAAKSVVIAVWPLAIGEATFHYLGNRASCIVDDSYTRPDIHDKLSQLFLTQGHMLKHFGWLPAKHLAVRSGLCEYGRNNITYCDDWGSFIRIGAYVSDIPVRDYVWREVKNLDACDSCGKCIASCPTGAILPHRFLIDNEKCLALLNDSANDIPNWVPKSAHHSLIECFRCQETCPLNKKRLSNMVRLEFCEAETRAILESDTFQGFPESIRKRLWYYETGDQFTCIPRNLALLLANVLDT